MRTRIPTLRLAIIGLVLPLSLLIGALVAGVIFATGVHQDIGAPLAAGSLLLCLMAGGGLWAHTLSRMLAQTGPRARRLIIASALSHAITTFVALQGLGALERELVEGGGTTLPLHVLYTLLFVPASFLTSGLLALVVSAAVGGTARTALVPALGSALAYLVLNVLQDLLGRRVGGPNASETATMITVTLVCTMGSAIVFTVVLGRQLHQILLGRDSELALTTPVATPIATTPTEQLGVER